MLLVAGSKLTYYRDTIINDGSTQKLFAFMDKSVIRNNLYCPMDRLRMLHPSINDYFVQKITRIRKNLDDQHRDLPIDLPELDPKENDHHFSEFDDVSPEQVEKIIKSASSATCTLDPIPNIDLETMYPRTLTNNHTNSKSIVGIWRISATDEEGLSQTFD